MFLEWRSYAQVLPGFPRDNCKRKLQALSLDKCKSANGDAGLIPLHQARSPDPQSASVGGGKYRLSDGKRRGEYQLWLTDTQFQ